MSKNKTQFTFQSYAARHDYLHNNASWSIYYKILDFLNTEKQFLELPWTLYLWQLEILFSFIGVKTGIRDVFEDIKEWFYQIRSQLKSGSVQPIDSISMAELH